MTAILELEIIYLMKVLKEKKEKNLICKNLITSMLVTMQN